MHATISTGFTYVHMYTGLVNTTSSYIEMGSGSREEPENGVLKFYQN